MSESNKLGRSSFCIESLLNLPHTPVIETKAEKTELLKSETMVATSLVSNDNMSLKEREGTLKG